MSDVELTDHARARLAEYGLPENDRFDELVGEADPNIYDKEHDSYIVVLNKLGHAAAIDTDETTGDRTVVTILPPPGDSWSDRIVLTDRYVAIDTEEADR